ncbi:MAG TPA: hypothetical protein VF650_15835 [Allosphingosinicella sp.]|jgi:tetratricopeptide (TPR) repeat protein
MAQEDAARKSWAESIRRLKARVDRWLGAALVGGVLASAFFGAASGAKVSAWPGALGLLIALCIVGGAFAVGAAAGFLFGLPRALTNGEARELARRDELPQGAAGGEGGVVGAHSYGAAGSSGSARTGGFGTNTNLERISDWLTTIIVGLGLANLGALPEALNGFGRQAGAFFSFGGHAFAIGAGLYFLIFGFLMSYISTRTKLVLIFTENELDKLIVEGGGLGAAISAAANASPYPAFRATSPSSISARLDDGESAQSLALRPAPASTADKLVIERVSQQADRTPDQVLALANASARAGDFAAALSLYRAYMRTTPFKVKVANDYAGVLGMNLDEQGFEELKAQFAANQAGSEIPAAENNYELGLRAALQTNLYNGRYEDAIQAGERLIGRRSDRTDAWAHLWLACAYGQRHRIVRSRAGDTEAETRAKAVEQVVKAVEKDRGMIPYIRTLYVPGRALGLDNDLESLHPDPVLEELLG